MALAKISIRYVVNNSYAFPKLSFVSSKDCVTLNISTVSLFIVCQTAQCTVLTKKCFYLQRNKGPSALLSTKDKNVTIILQKNQRLNLEN